MCRSLKQENFQVKTIKEEGRERARVRENWWLLISWVQSLRSLYLLWFFCPGFPQSFQWVSPFLKASWRWASLNCDSDFVLDPPWSLYSSQTQTEAPVCFSALMIETLYYLMRIGCADHEIQFTSILGKSTLSVSDCSKRPYWFLNHSKHLYCLCQANPVIFSTKDWERQHQEDIIQDPGLSRRPHCILFKGGIAVASRILGESETHTSQPEPLCATPTNIQTQHISWLYFTLLVSIKGFSH